MFYSRHSLAVSFFFIAVFGTFDQGQAQQTGGVSEKQEDEHTIGGDGRETIVSWDYEVSETSSVSDVINLRLIASVDMEVAQVKLVQKIEGIKSNNPCGDQVRIDNARLQLQDGKLKLDATLDYQRWTCTSIKIPETRCTDTWIKLPFGVKTKGISKCSVQWSTKKTKTRILSQHSNVMMDIMPKIVNGNEIIIEAKPISFDLSNNQFVHWNNEVRDLVQRELNNTLNKKKIFLDFIETGDLKEITVKSVMFIEDKDSHLGARIELNALLNKADFSSIQSMTNSNSKRSNLVTSNDLTPTPLIILDASYSMIDPNTGKRSFDRFGVSKTFIKEVIERAFKINYKIPSLVTFGRHHENFINNDCQNIFVEFEDMNSSRENADRAIKIVDEISALGRSPILPTLEKINLTFPHGYINAVMITDFNHDALCAPAKETICPTIQKLITDPLTGKQRIFVDVIYTPGISEGQRSNQLETIGQCLDAEFVSLDSDDQISTSLDTTIKVLYKER